MAGPLYPAMDVCPLTIVCNRRLICLHPHQGLHALVNTFGIDMVDYLVQPPSAAPSTEPSAKLAISDPGIALNNASW